MSAGNPIDAYLAELRVELKRCWRGRRLCREADGHLREAVAHKVAAGIAPAQAAAEAIEGFGTAREVAAALARARPESRRPLKVLVVVTGVAAVAAAVAIPVRLLTGPSEDTVADSRVSAGWIRPSVVEDSRRVVAALGLSKSAADALRKAQWLGREATACLIAHGGQQRPDGGISDPSGAAAAACRAEISANEEFLDSSEFVRVLAAARPTFEAAASCLAHIGGFAEGTGIGAGPFSPGIGAPGDGVPVPCFRSDGLPDRESRTS